MLHISLSEADRNTLLTTLKARFEKNMHRHIEIAWSTVEKILLSEPTILLSVYQMENTGGDPDVVILAGITLAYCDCSTESPIGRRSLCYDKEAWASRKQHKPSSNVMDSAAEMGISVLNESQYAQLQELEPLDLKTSSWLLTPSSIRAKKGALFGDRRYDHVFTYHNGADSYYASRGYRGFIKLQ